MSARPTRPVRDDADDPPAVGTSDAPTGLRSGGPTRRHRSYAVAPPRPAPGPSLPHERPTDPEPAGPRPTVRAGPPKGDQVPDDRSGRGDAPSQDPRPRGSSTRGAPAADRVLGDAPGCSAATDLGWQDRRTMPSSREPVTPPPAPARALDVADAAFVTEQLLVGGDLDTRDHRLAATQLRELLDAGLTHVVDARVEWSDEEWVRQLRPARRLPAPRHGRRRAAGPRCLVRPRGGWALEAIAEGGVVLTHCHMGINRGPSLGFAVLLAQGWDPVEALDRIRAGPADRLGGVRRGGAALAPRARRLDRPRARARPAAARRVARHPRARPRRRDPPQARPGLVATGRQHSMTASSQVGLITRQPSASTRICSARSAVMTTTSWPRSRAAAASFDSAAVAVARGVDGAQVRVAAGGDAALGLALEHQHDLVVRRVGDRQPAVQPRGRAGAVTPPPVGA